MLLIAYISAEVALKDTILLVLMPRDGNLGDQAIAEASVQFFKEKFKSHEIIQTYSSQDLRELVQLSQ